MFTGIVEALGTVLGIERRAETIRLKISASFAPQLELGESVAVNGVCLTAEAKDKESFTAQVMPQTFRSTNLSTLQKGAKVNLERALQLSSRLGGHLVTGHVDCTARILELYSQGNAKLLRLEAPGSIAPFLLAQGSIALDGTSLTIVAVERGAFTVSLIPHTRAVTILGERQVGERVNVEADLIGKYLYRFSEAKGASLDWERLAKLGFD